MRHNNRSTKVLAALPVLTTMLLGVVLSPIAGVPVALAQETSADMADTIDDPSAVQRAAYCPAPEMSGGAVEFLPPSLTTIYIRSPISDSDEAEEHSSAIRDLILSRLGAEVAIVTVASIDAVTLDPEERMIVIDDELGIPSQPQTYDRARTLYVHSTSAVADLAPLFAEQCLEIGPGLAATWVLAEDGAKVLTGYVDDISFRAALPIGWQVIGDARFQTEVVATEIARDDLSLRLDVDDRPIDTWSLAEHSTIDVTLAPELFADGGLTLTAGTTAPIKSDVACVDPGHVGRWVDIGTPTVSGLVAPADIDVARAVASFGPIAQLTGLPVTIAAHGPVSDPATLETIGAVVAAVAQHGAPPRWDIVTASETEGDLRIEIVPVAGGPATASVLVEGARTVLTLTGDPANLVEMAHAMAHPDRLLYFHATEVHAKSVPAIEGAATQEVFGFDAAGYDDRTLRGNGEKSLVYRLHIPAGVPPDRATLALYGTYNPALAEAEATVSVRVNGSEEEIVAVADETGRLEVLHTLTPANLRPGLNYVKVTADMGGQGAACVSSGAEGWITISRTSALAAELEDTPAPPAMGVEDARFALAAVDDFRQADVVLVPRFTIDELHQALVVIGELADRSEGGSPRLVTDDQVDLTRHLVVVGAAKERDLLDDIIPVELNDSVGLVAAMPSPHATGRVMLAITGGNLVSTNLAVDAALSHRVNDMTSAFALVSLDRVEAVGDTVLSVNRTPEQLAFSHREPGPPVDEYEAWLLAQAARIEAATAPQVEIRRMLAFGLLLFAATLLGLGWIRKVRLGNAAGHAGPAAGH